MGSVAIFPPGVKFPVPGWKEDRVVYKTNVGGQCTEWCEDPTNDVGQQEAAKEGGGLALSPANEDEPPYHRGTQGRCGELEDFA